ncbi:hypothetical protein GQ42DRAFT_124960 [Ramicandelaber brevisporus]|nr:hypothetical protein GQ42DRAFT_124960 [Ramicandelaber brevisporus]
MEEDPFTLVRADVDAGFDSADKLLKQLQQKQQPAAAAATTATNTSRLNSLLRTIEADLNELEQAIDIAQSDPVRFGLTTAELRSRRDYVDMKRRALQAMKSDAERQSRSQLFDTSSGNNNGGFEVDTNNNTIVDVFDNENRRQRVMLEQQDEQLDGVIGAVRNMRVIANEMNRELEEQDDLLSDVNNRTSNTQDKLSSAMSKVNKMIQDNKKDKTFWVIGALVILIIVLIILISS